MSFSKSVSSSSISPVSRTTKMSVQSFRTRSTQGSSSNMMDLEIPLKNSLTNFPMTSTTDMYRPTILKKRSGGRKFSILSCHVGKMYTKQSHTVGPGTYPCPARKPRLEGLTLSLNITISMLWQLWSETEVHSSTTHHWSACPSDVTVICWSLMDIGLKKSRSGRSECPAGKQARISSHQDYPIQIYIFQKDLFVTSANINWILVSTHYSSYWPIFILVAILDSGPLGPLMNFGRRELIILQDRGTLLK